MPMSHFTKVFAAKDAKIFPMLTDPAAGPPTYGTGVDVPGLKSIAITGSVDTKQLRGDNSVLDQFSILTDVSAALEFAKLQLDLLAAAFTGATVVDSGTTPNQKALWTLTGASGLSYVGITAQAVGADTLTGDVQFMIHKATLNAFPELGLAEEDYKTQSIGFACSPTIGTGNKWITVALNETAAAVAAPA